MIFCTVDCTVYRLNVSRHVVSAVYESHAREVRGGLDSRVGSEDCNLGLCIVEGQDLSDEHER